MPGAPSPPGGGGGASEVLVHELTRLRNELKVKDMTIEERSMEVDTLSKQLRVAQEGVAAAEAALAEARDRSLGAQGDAQSLRKQLAAVQAERDALRREIDDAEQGALRARDRDMEAMNTQAAAAEAAHLRCRELESAVTSLSSKLLVAEEEVATLQRLHKAAAGEVEEARREADKARRELGTASDYLAGVMTELAAAQDQLQTVRKDNKSLTEQLAAAERSAAAANEARAAAQAAAKAAPAAEAGGAAASATAALQQALQQLGLRTAEVSELKKQLEVVQQQHGADGPGSGRGDAASDFVPGGSGPATPAADADDTAAGLPPSSSVATVAGSSVPVSPTAAASAAAAVAAAEAAAEAADSSPAGAAAADQGEAAVGPSSMPSSATAAGAAAKVAGLQVDLAAANQQIADLQRQVAQLRQHLADAAAADSDDEDEGSAEVTPRGSSHPTSPTAATALSPAEVAAEERRRNTERGRHGSLWLGGQRTDRAYSQTALTASGLASIIDKLISARDEQARSRPAARTSSPAPFATDAPPAGLRTSEDGGGGATSRNDTALWEEATGMLRGELIRLGREAALKMEENERLRSEVGELKTARFSAEAMATRLEEMNALSIRVASLKLEIAALKSEQDIREDALLGQVAALQAQLAKKKKRRSPGKMLKKAAEGIKHALDRNPSPTREAAAGASPAASAGAYPAEPPADGRSWMSKMASLGRRTSEQ